MNLPQIDLSSLPDLGSLTGVFGSLFHTGQVDGWDDSVIIVMVAIYDVVVTHNVGG